MKIPGFVFPILFIAIACNNDIDKNITTDLQVEGNELFNVRLALEESMIYPLLTIDQYRIKTDTLPGCPQIDIDESSRKVTLTFNGLPGCPGQNLLRTGKITLKYLVTNSLETTVLMEYENYKFKTFDIIGKRKFRNVKSLVNPNKRTETFEDILVIDQFDSSTKISGTFEHQLSYTDTKFSGFSSSGNVDGRNITGRRIRMNQINPKIYKVSCIKQGVVLPASGTEKWEIFRTQNLAVSHTIQYNQDLNCLSEAEIRLSDGRSLILTQ